MDWEILTPRSVCCVLVLGVICRGRPILSESFAVRLETICKYWFDASDRTAFLWVIKYLDNGYINFGVLLCLNDDLDVRVNYVHNRLLFVLNNVLIFTMNFFVMLLIIFLNTKELNICGKKYVGVENKHVKNCMSWCDCISIHKHIANHITNYNNYQKISLSRKKLWLFVLLKDHNLSLFHNIAFKFQIRNCFDSHK